MNQDQPERRKNHCENHLHSLSSCQAISLRYFNPLIQGRKSNPTTKQDREGRDPGRRAKMLLDILSLLLVPLLVNHASGQTSNSNSSNSNASVFPSIPNAIHYPIYVPLQGQGQFPAASSGMPALTGLTPIPFDPWMSPLASDTFADWNTINDNPFLEVYDEQQLLAQKELLQKKQQLSRDRDNLRKDAHETRKRIHSSAPSLSSYDHRSRDPSQEDNPLPSPPASTLKGSYIKDSPASAASSSYSFNGGEVGSRSLSRRRPIYNPHPSSSSEYESFPTSNRGVDLMRLPRGRRRQSEQNSQDRESLSGVRGGGNIIRNHRYFSRINA